MGANDLPNGFKTKENYCDNWQKYAQNFGSFIAKLYPLRKSGQGRELNIKENAGVLPSILKQV